MSTTTAARPRQTTMAGAMVMLAAIFVVLSVWDTVSRLRSIETRESITQFLSDAPGRSLNVSVETMIQVVHGISIVAALCAVASVALGWQVLQRSKQARIALSIVVVPLFVTGLIAGGFMSSLVAAATAMLWLSPSREWFAGRPIPVQGKVVSRDRLQAWNHNPTQTPNPDPNPDQTATPNPDSDQTPNPNPDSDQTPTQPSTQHPAQSAGAPPATWPVAASATDKRPDPVSIALVLTLVVAGTVFVMTLVSMVLLASQPDMVLEELRRQNPDIEANGVSESLLLSTSYVSGGLVVLWSMLAAGLAVLMAGRRAWAARALTICAGVCALLCLVATLATPVALVPAFAAVVTVSCLRRPDVRAWFDGH